MPPLIHDVRAARDDLPLYDDLHRRTALVAESRIQEALREATSSGATQLLHKQLRGLQEFIAGEPVELRSDPASDEALLVSLKGFVEEDVVRVVGDDAALSKDLSLEFAVGLWDVLLRKMGRHVVGAAVQREGLDIIPTGGDATVPWEELDRTLEPYRLQRKDAGKILCTVFAQLSDATRGEQIELPLGLRIDKGMLARMLRGVPEPRQKQPPAGILHEGGGWKNTHS